MIHYTCCFVILKICKYICRPHACWCLGYLHCQCTSSQRIAFALTEYACHSTRTIDPSFHSIPCHYNDVIMTTIASQITSLTVVYSTVYSDEDQRKQKLRALTFVWGIHRDRWIPRTNGQLRGKCFHLMTSSCGPVAWLIAMRSQKRNDLSENRNVDKFIFSMPVKASW